MRSKQRQPYLSRGESVSAYWTIQWEIVKVTANWIFLKGASNFIYRSYSICFLSIFLWWLVFFVFSSISSDYKLVHFIHIFRLVQIPINSYHVQIVIKAEQNHQQDLPLLTFIGTNFDSLILIRIICKTKLVSRNYSL